MNFQLRSLWVAVGFLTRIPVGDPSRGGTKPVRMAAAVPWFPIVGLGIGLVQGLVWRGLNELTSPTIAAVLSVAVAMLVTGAFHHDGLADMADAFGGGWTVEQRMEILKDSRLGTYGTTALTLALVTEAAAISSLDPVDGARAILAAHVVGRGLAVAAMLFAPTGGDGLGAAYMADLRPFTATVSVVFAAVIGAAALRDAAMFALPLAALMTVGVALLSMRKIGGVTGDVLGAIHVMAALTILVAATL
jgi:adenosylcobinamide-GDP ribazoletransferase